MCYTTGVKRFMSFGQFICTVSNEGFFPQVISYSAGFFLHIHVNRNAKENKYDVTRPPFQNKAGETIRY